MIALRELREGNWVKNWDIITRDNKKREGKPHKISKEDFANTLLDLFDPIPLTPDLFNKCGFMVAAHHTYKHTLLPCFVFKCNEEFEDELHIGWWAYLTGDCNDLLTCYEVNYLHQLQNFFLTVTDEELEILF